MLKQTKNLKEKKKNKVVESGNVAVLPCGCKRTRLFFAVKFILQTHTKNSLGSRRDLNWSPPSHKDEAGLSGLKQQLHGRLIHNYAAAKRGLYQELEMANFHTENLEPLAKGKERMPRNPEGSSHDCFSKHIQGPGLGGSQRASAKDASGSKAPECRIKIPGDISPRGH